MPSLEFEKLESFVVEAVKTTLEAQFGFSVQGVVSQFAPTKAFWQSTILEASIVLQSTLDTVGLRLYVAGQTISQCMTPLMGSELAIDDPCVLESPGEFLNVSAGLLRKHLNSQLKLDLDMSCAENKGMVSVVEFEKQNIAANEQSALFLFKTNYGEVFFTFWSDTIHVTKNRLAS